MKFSIHSSCCLWVSSLSWLHYVCAYTVFAFFFRKWASTLWDGKELVPLLWTILQCSPCEASYSTAISNPLPSLQNHSASITKSGWHLPSAKLTNGRAAGRAVQLSWSHSSHRTDNHRALVWLLLTLFQLQNEPEFCVWCVCCAPVHVTTRQTTQRQSECSFGPSKIWLLDWIAVLGASPWSAWWEACNSPHDPVAFSSQLELICAAPPSFQSRCCACTFFWLICWAIDCVWKSHAQHSTVVDHGSNLTVKLWATPSGNG